MNPQRRTIIASTLSEELVTVNGVEKAMPAEKLRSILDSYFPTKHHRRMFAVPAVCESSIVRSPVGSGDDRRSTEISFRTNILPAGIVKGESVPSAFVFVKELVAQTGTVLVSCMGVI